MHLNEVEFHMMMLNGEVPHMIVEPQEEHNSVYV